MKIKFNSRLITLMILIIMINNVYCGFGSWWDSSTNSTKNESTITAAQPSSLEGKEKIPIDDIANDQEMNDELHTISSLYSNYPNTNGNYTEATPYQTKPYDRDPQQSPFVDSNVQHPTESHEMDPRFAQRRQCQEGTYMCRKVNPQQDHIRCIPNEWKCNGVRECEENDDEENCSYNMHRPAPNGCKEPEQYTCYGSGINGLPAQCIDSRKLCDGTYDCIYGDDEQKDRCPKVEENVNVPHESDPMNVQRAPQHQYQQQQHQVAPTTNHYQQQQQQQQRPQQQQNCNGRSEEYIQRLEFIDRCFRTCLKTQN